LGKVQQTKSTLAKQQ